MIYCFVLCRTRLTTKFVTTLMSPVTFFITICTIICFHGNLSPTIIYALPHNIARFCFTNKLIPHCGVGDRSRTCIIRICNPRPNHSATHLHKTGIPPGIRTPSCGFGDRNAAVNTREIFNLLLFLIV